MIDPEKLNRNQLRVLTIEQLLNLGKHLSKKTKKEFLIDAVVVQQLVSKGGRK